MNDPSLMSPKSSAGVTLDSVKIPVLLDPFLGSITHRLLGKLGCQHFENPEFSFHYF
jgi:hypothetical protein